jgi:hypothetical protein
VRGGRRRRRGRGLGGWVRLAPLGNLARVWGGKVVGWGLIDLGGRMGLLGHVAGEGDPSENLLVVFLIFCGNYGVRAYEMCDVSITPESVIRHR